MNIIIPANLQKLLDKDPVWSAKVTGLQKNVEPFLVNQLEFFPDYTIHSAAHINEVLEHADRLIHPKTYEILKARDAAFLIGAVILHDLGMFLSAAGVRGLLAAHDEWQSRWETFVDRTKRYTEEKMLYCFGRNITVKEVVPPADEMTRYDRLVVGEFLRQNHPELAHEIALGVMPGAEDQDIFRNTGFKSKERDMIGLLARSHGMAIRETESFLEEDTAHPYNTPAYYLMAVLRIADLLDAGEHRAPVALEKLRGVPVPLSLEEWKWNQCIDRDACRWDTKKNNRRIDAEPGSSIEYVQLDKWLRSIQAELDLSWSVIAEKYPDEPYRLSIHRITCNIYDPGVREKMGNDFLTKEVKVTANPEITKLMIDPLYGSNPSYGVRELIQNAVDACIEREHKEKDPAYKGLVTVRIDPWEDPVTKENLGVFTIEDNGIGMDENVLMNYYLSAGASYRSSDEWRRDYTENNQAQIARTGKFGVGFLAAFLLGDRIQVHTQHKDHKKGYQFEFDNHAKPLNVTRVKRERGAGTSIRIVLKRGVWRKLYTGGEFPWFNWYAFDEPEVQYFLNGKEVQYEGVSLSRDPAKNSDWLSLKPEPFEAYQWNPGINGSSSDPAFFCNGIRVYGTQQDKTLQDHGLEVPFPHFSLLDPNTELDIDLARARLQTFPQAYKLPERTLRYHIARLLLTPWETEEDHRRNFLLGFRLRSSDKYGRIPFLVTSGGFALNYITVLSVMDIPQYAILYYSGDRAEDAVEAAFRFLPSHLPASIAIGCENYTVYREELHSLHASYLFKDASWFADVIGSDHRGLFDRMAIGYSIWDNHCYFQISDQVPLITDFDSKIAYSRELEHHGSLRLFETAPLISGSPMEAPIAVDEHNAQLFPVVMQTDFDFILYRFREYGNPYLLFPQLLKELLGPNEAHPDRDMWIPFDMEERKKKFPEAFEELEPYFDYIRRNPIP